MATDEDAVERKKVRSIAFKFINISISPSMKVNSFTIYKKIRYCFVFGKYWLIEKLI